MNGMELERDTVIEAAIAIVAVVVFAAAIVGIGMASGGSVSGLTLVAAIAGFILLMAVVGVLFAFR